MKKIIFLITLITLVFVTANITLAATTTTDEADTSATPTSTTASLNQLDQLKEKIASKVAQLKLTEKRGMIGTVTESTSTQITVLDMSNNQRFIDIDELTKFSSPSDKSFGISDLEKGDRIGILGIYNKQSQRILARQVDLVTVPEFINGVVSSINKVDYSLTVITESQKETTIDIENITKTYSYTIDTGLLKSGFSKITTGTNIVLVGYQNKTDKKRVIASKVILLPEIPKDPLINIADEALLKGATIVPSTGSGKKLTPIVK
jgi:hypothetical protein